MNNNNKSINLHSFDGCKTNGTDPTVYKGTSFRFPGIWHVGFNYHNDDRFIDFVSYNGSLWGCLKSNIGSEESAPIDGSEYWSKVLDSVKGDCYIPTVVNEKLVFNLSDNPGDNTIEISTIKGNPGKDGSDGVNGHDGVDGKDGKTYIPDSSLKDGRYIIFRDQSNYSNKIEVDCIDLKGEKGDTGPKGSDGKSWVFSAIKLISIDSDRVGYSELKADYPGMDDTTYTLILYIPKGVKGDKGDAGDKGDSIKGDKGDPGPTPVFKLSLNNENKSIELLYTYSGLNYWNNLGPIGGKSPKLIRVLGDANEPGSQDSTRRNDRILWGYDGLPLSEWTTLCYLDELRGDENIWFGCDSPVMPDNKTPDLDKIWYDPCDKSIDVWKASDFIYQAYTEIGGNLTKLEFEEVFSSLKKHNGIPIEFRSSYDQLGSQKDGIARAEDQGIIWIIPSDNPSKRNLYTEYMAIESPDSVGGKEYMWEIIGGTGNGSGGGSDILPYDNIPSQDSKDGSSGDSEEYSRGDHSHPSDESKTDIDDLIYIQNKINELIANYPEGHVINLSDYFADVEYLIKDRANIAFSSDQVFQRLTEERQTIFSKCNSVCYYDSPEIGIGFIDTLTKTLRTIIDNNGDRKIVDYILLSNKDIIDDLNSNNPFYVLSANQGRILNDKIESINNNINILSNKYHGDGTTIIETPNDTSLIFSVGVISQDKVDGLVDSLNNKVDKVEGSRLITESEVSKLSAIESGAQVNKIESILVDGKAVTIIDKAASIPNADDTTYGVITKNIVKSIAGQVAGSVYKVKGTKSTIDEVLSINDVVIGDVYNVISEFTLNNQKFTAGTNVVFVGPSEEGGIINPSDQTQWDALGGTVDLTNYITIEQANNSFDSKGSSESALTISKEYTDQSLIWKDTTYKTKLLHFETLDAYNAERNKTQEGSEERKTFDAYLSFIDEGPILCTWGKTYKCDISAEEVDALIESKNYITLEDIQNITAIPVAIIDLTNNTVTDESNALQLATEGKPSMIYIKYSISSLTLYSFGNVLGGQANKTLIVYNKMNLTGNSSNYLIEVTKEEATYEISELPNNVNSMWIIGGKNGVYNATYPNEITYSDDFNTLRLALMSGRPINLGILNLVNSNYGFVYPSSINLNTSSEIEVRTKAVPGIINDDLLIKLTESSINITADSLVFSSTLTGEGDTLSGTIEGNAWGKLVKLIMPNGAYSYIDLTEYSIGSDGDSRYAKRFTSIIFSDDAAYDCSIEFLGTAESVLVTVKKPITVKGTMQATNFKEV